IVVVPVAMTVLVAESEPIETKADTDRIVDFRDEPVVDDGDRAAEARAEAGAVVVTVVSEHEVRFGLEHVVRLRAGSLDDALGFGSSGDAGERSGRESERSERTV